MPFVAKEDGTWTISLRSGSRSRAGDSACLWSHLCALDACAVHVALRFQMPALRETWVQRDRDIAVLLPHELLHSLWKANLHNHVLGTAEVLL